MPRFVPRKSTIAGIRSALKALTNACLLRRIYGVPRIVRRRNWQRTTDAPHPPPSPRVESIDSVTTGMPHRPASSDGRTAIFVSSNPIGLR